MVARKLPKKKKAKKPRKTNKKNKKRKGQQRKKRKRKLQEKKISKKNKKTNKKPAKLKNNTKNKKKMQKKQKKKNKKNIKQSKEELQKTIQQEKFKQQTKKKKRGAANLRLRRFRLWPGQELCETRPPAEANDRPSLEGSSKQSGQEPLCPVYWTWEPDGPAELGYLVRTTIASPTGRRVQSRGSAQFDVAAIRTFPYPTVSGGRSCERIASSSMPRSSIGSTRGA